MADEELKQGKQSRKYEFIVPAGFLIGLGVGLLVDYVFSGILIGLGLGFLGLELISFTRKPQESEGLHQGYTNGTNFLIGAFLIFIGVGIVWAPVIIWPYAIAGFLILIGLWLLLRGFSAIS